MPIEQARLFQILKAQLLLEWYTHIFSQGPPAPFQSSCKVDES